MPHALKEEMNAPLPPSSRESNSQRVICYVRVSTEQQARDGLSLEIQRERLLAEADRKGWEVVAVIEDAGESGATYERPGIREMIRIVKQSPVNFVLCASLDRFGRDLPDGAYLFKHVLEPRKVHLLSLDGGDTRSEHGRMFFYMALMIAEAEHKRIRQRTRDGLAAAAREGRWPGGRQPYAYDYDSKKREFRVIEAEAQIVRLVFDLYLRRLLSTHQISRELRARGILTRKGKRPGPTWICRILGHTAYTGLMDHSGKYKIPLPRIITDEDFAAAQARLASGTKKSRGALKRKILASRWTYCGECETAGRQGIKMFPSKWSFGCGTQYKSVANRLDQKKYRVGPCANVRVPIERLDNLLWAHILKLFQDKYWRSEILSAARSEAADRVEETREELLRLEDRLKQNNAEQSRLATLFAKGTLTEIVIEQEGGKLKDESRHLSEAIALARRRYQAAEAASRVTDSSLKTPVRDLNDMTFESQRALLEVLFAGEGDGLHVFKNGHVEVRARWSPERVKAFLNPTPTATPEGALLPLVPQAEWHEAQQIRAHTASPLGYES